MVETIKKIGNPPKHSKESFYLWADYFELMCLINKDGKFSQTDFVDRVFTIQKDLEDVDKISGNNKATTIEKRKQFSEDCYSLLESRTGTFKTFYPFELNDDLTTLSLRKELNDQHKLYIFLLVASNLGYFNSFQSTLTSGFEVVSYYALKNFLPSKGKIYFFGSSNTEQLKEDKVKAIHIWDKFNELAESLNEKVLKPKEYFSKYNKGDGGLDLAAAIDMGDNQKHKPLLFAQCACTDGWTTKQFSSKYDKLSNIISLSTYPINLIFIPFSFRDAKGDWHKDTEIAKSVLLDRQRIIYHIKSEYQFFSDTDSYKVIDEIIKNKESIV